MKNSKPFFKIRPDYAAVPSGQSLKMSKNRPSANKTEKKSKINYQTLRIQFTFWGSKLNYKSLMMVLLLILNYFFLIYVRKKNYITKIFLIFLNNILMICMTGLTKVTPANWKFTKKEINTKRQKKIKFCSYKKKTTKQKVWMS